MRYEDRLVTDNEDDEISDRLNNIMSKGGHRSHRNSMYRESRQSDSNLSSIKMKIPPFQGRNNLEAYLDWELKVDQVFDIHRYSEEKKVKLATIGIH